MKALCKEHVKRAFSISAGTYDGYATLQREAACELMGYVPCGAGFRRIVDAGCGTGLVTGFLLESFPQAEILCFDIALPMVEQVREKFKGRIIVFGADCERLPLRAGASDLVVSNLTYQWMPDQLCAFSEVARVLRKGGYFVFSTLGGATFRELRSSVEKVVSVTGRASLPPLMEFRGAEQIEGLLRRAGFRDIDMERRLKVRSYASLWQFLRTLKHTGATNPSRDGSRSLSRGMLLKEVEQVYRREFSSDEGIRVSYDLLYVVARK